jgi:hypothetical protein
MKYDSFRYCSAVPVIKYWIWLWWTLREPNRRSAQQCCSATDFLCRLPHSLHRWHRSIWPTLISQVVGSRMSLIGQKGCPGRSPQLVAKRELITTIHCRRGSQSDSIAWTLLGRELEKSIRGCQIHPPKHLDVSSNREMVRHRLVIPFATKKTSISDCHVYSRYFQS